MHTCSRFRHLTIRKGKCNMTTDLTSKISLKQKCKNIRKIFFYINKMERGYFALVAVMQAINVTISFMALILSATVLNMISGGKSAKEIIGIVFIFLIAYLILNISSAYCGKYVEVKRESIGTKWQYMITNKMMEMDYSLVESPLVREMRGQMQRDLNWGAGINSVLWQYGGLVINLFFIIGAVIINIPIVYRIISSKNILGSAMILMVYIISIILVKCQVRKLEQYQSRLLNKSDEPEEQAKKYELTWGMATEEQYEYKNGKDVRIYDGYELFDEYTYGRMERFSRAYTHKTGKMAAMAESMRDGIKGFMYASGYFVVGFITLGGSLAVGSLVQYAGAMQNMFSGVVNLAWSFWELAISARKHLSTLELIELQDEMYKGKLPVEKRSDNEYEIEFDHVYFKYPGAEEYALKDFSLKIRIGEKMAVVGMNGSGKTTMIKLLCKLYEPTEGRILLNGVDIRKFDADEYRKLFSVVFQDFKLFSLELGENVSGSERYDKEKVTDCLEKAGFVIDEEKMNNGLDTCLYKNYDDSGVEISGGEAQKIAIARALYKEAPFILLDEPTASLDPLAENEIYSKFDRIVGTKTAIYISHRLSSCKFCNDIVVFDNGRLIQRGSHEELLKDVHGKYYEMWNAQAQYYQT